MPGTSGAGEPRGARLSIGLPVYNGRPYLSQAIESILAQSFENFRLLVVDNASTDGSAELANAYAARDSRVLVHRNDSNLGAPANFNRAFALAPPSTYFKWAAADDLLRPRFLERCVARLDGDPGGVLAFSAVEVIGADGGALRDYAVSLPRQAASAPWLRFADLVLIRHACYQAFGVIRRSALEATPRIGSFLSSDRCLLAELSLHGRFLEVPERLYGSREHGERSVRIPTHARAADWFGQAGSRGYVFPYWRLLREYSAAVGRAPLSARARLRCRTVLLRWLGANWRLLRGDFRVAARRTAQRVQRGLRAGSAST